jgi:glycerol-3-phosphate dehydrogenase
MPVLRRSHPDGAPNGHARRGGAAPDPARLDPEQRASALERMSREQFDVLVIGGGVTGAGAALDAVTRGLSVALVEKRDFAAGTSSRSSKLIHGGLRYLEHFEFGLVREALRERALLLGRLAPHLVRPVPLLVPLTHHGWERGYLGAGMVLYDGLGGRGALPGHRHLTRRAALRLAPGMRRSALVGAIQYHDAQVDDARHVVTVARTAAHYGAQVATSARVTGFLREGERVVGAQVLDLESGRELEVRARQVINATGAWTDELQDLVGRGRFRVRPSKGIHLVVPRDRIAADTGLTIRTETSVLFVIPWGRHWLIGTTDTEWNLGLDHPAASASDIDYLLEHVNAVLSQPLDRADVEGVYAGLRPLLSGESDETSTLSREHAIAHPVPGLITIAGGKYTTYRVMGKDAIDAAVRNLEERQGVPSCTDRIELLGASGFPALFNRRHEIAEQSGLHVARVEHLLGRYGTLIGDLLALIAADRSLAEPLDGADDYLAVEAHYAASHEGALHLDDLLTRRTRISIETWDRGVAAAEHISRVVAGPLGWDETTRKRELEHYRARIAAERDSQDQPDDATADAARMGAPDVRLAGAGGAAAAAPLEAPEGAH